MMGQATSAKVESSDAMACLASQDQTSPTTLGASPVPASSAGHAPPTAGTEVGGLCRSEFEGSPDIHGAADVEGSAAQVVTAPAPNKYLSVRLDEAKDLSAGPAAAGAHTLPLAVPAATHPLALRYSTTGRRAAQASVCIAARPPTMAMSTGAAPRRRCRPTHRPPAARRYQPPGANP